MSAWPSQASRLTPWRRTLGAASGLALSTGGLVLFLGATLLVRVLTDDLSSPNSRHSGSLNLSGAIAVLFILVAGGLLLRRRHGVLPTVLAVLWLCVWTAVAVNTSGASTETLREGVREGSVIALAVIVYNARGAVTIPIATRLVQLVGFAPALLALYQLATHTGMDVSGQLRSNGTFAQPNSAVMFFGLAAIASLWRYLDYGRRRSDALLVTLFAAAVISTYSVDGLISVVAMMAAFGALLAGPWRDRLVPYMVGGLVVLVFFATPLGSQRISKESSTSVATTEGQKPNSDLAWRLHKWKTLIPDWERSPLFGRGLGTTTTEAAIPKNAFAGTPPLNEYVRYLVETGVVGFMILLGALAVLIRRLVRRRRIPGTLDAGTLNAATLALAVIAGCLVNSLADNTFLDSPTCYAAALIVVAVLSLPGIEVRRAPASQAV
jgi:O-antigen ligase